jgi:hypothetical protein
MKVRRGRKSPSTTRFLMLLVAFFAIAVPLQAVQVERSLGQTSVRGPTSGTASQTIDVDAFRAAAAGAQCATETNRLFAIDGQMVFWTWTGNCADFSSGSALFGSTPTTSLCSASETIAGPRTTCTDQHRRLFSLRFMLASPIWDWTAVTRSSSSHRPEAWAGLSGSD